MESDLLIDRRRLKRKLLFWRIAVVVILTVVGFTLFSDRDSEMPGFGGDHVARLSVHGVIYDDPARDEAVARLVDDDSVKAVIVALDSPGGTIVGSQNLYEGLRRVAAKKPVVAVMSQVAASGGYMTAIAADRIFARTGTVTGSIGVIMQSANVTGLMEKIGVEPVIIKSAPLKASPNPMEPTTKEALKAMEVVIMDMYEIFVDMVTERRSFDRAKTLKLADGRVFTGRQALKEGLIDEIGGEIEARQWLASNREISESLPIHKVKIEREEEWGHFFGSILGKTLFSERLRLDGLLSLWHPELR